MDGKELEYKGYKTKIEHDKDTDVYHGVIEGIDEFVYFESPDPDKIEDEFHAAVDNYIACKENGSAEAIDDDAD